MSALPLFDDILQHLQACVCLVLEWRDAGIKQKNRRNPSRPNVSRMIRQDSWRQCRGRRSTRRSGRNEERNFLFFAVFFEGEVFRFQSSNRITLLVDDNNVDGNDARCGADRDRWDLSRRLLGGEQCWSCSQIENKDDREGGAKREVARHNNLPVEEPRTLP